MRIHLPLVCLTVLTAACGGGTMDPSASPTPTPTTAPTAAATATPTPTPTAPDPGPVVVRGATMMGANGHAVAGRAEIVRNGGAYTLELRGNFRIDSANNEVYLTNDRGSRDGGLRLGDLNALSGPMTYSMGGNDGGAYSHVLIWCVPFRVPIGVGDLR